MTVGKSLIDSLLVSCEARAACRSLHGGLHDALTAGCVVGQPSLGLAVPLSVLALLAALGEAVVHEVPEGDLEGPRRFGDALGTLRILLTLGELHSDLLLFSKGPGCRGDSGELAEVPAIGLRPSVDGANVHDTLLRGHGVGIG